MQPNKSSRNLQDKFHAPPKKEVSKKQRKVLESNQENVLGHFCYISVRTKCPSWNVSPLSISSINIQLQESENSNFRFPVQVCNLMYWDPRHQQTIQLFFDAAWFWVWITLCFRTQLLACRQKTPPSGFLFWSTHLHLIPQQSRQWRSFSWCCCPSAAAVLAAGTGLCTISSSFCSARTYSIWRT